MQITAQQEPGQPGSRSSTPGRGRADVAALNVGGLRAGAGALMDAGRALSEGGAGAAESTAVMEKAMSSIESFKSTVTELKSKMSDLKQDFSNLKNELSNLKKEKPPQEKVDLKDRECNYCNKTGHTESFLRQAQCLPLPHTHLPHLPTFPHRLYTPPHTSTAPPHPTAPPDPRQPYPIEYLLHVPIDTYI